MREKVVSLAQGKFEYKRPEIICSVKCLQIEVTEGEEAVSSFSVSNSAGTKMKGFGAADSFCFDFLPVFDGKENELTVKVRAANHKAGEILSGNLSLVTDCGEYLLPYEVKVVAKSIVVSTGKLHHYAEFVSFAKEHFDEAVTVFYQDKFEKVLLKQWGEKRLYQKLTQKNPKKQALEEFLVTHGDKAPVRFGVEQTELFLEVGQEDLTGEIVVSKESWGMIGIKVSLESKYISFDKSFLYESDFRGNRAVIRYRVQASDVTTGIHHATLVLENMYQKIQVAIRIHGKEGQAERQQKREKQRIIAVLAKAHIQYMMNSSLRDSWIYCLEQYRRQICEKGQEWELLLDGYLAALSGDIGRKDAYANAMEGMQAPELGAKTEKVQRYVLATYVRCLSIESQEEKNDLIRKIVNYYQNGYRNWRLLVLLERLGYYESNSRALMAELDEFWEEGVFSPYLHMYRMMLLLQHQGLLKKLDGKTIGALRFGIKYDLVAEDTAITLSFLAARQKCFSPALMSLLESCYQIYENEDTLQSICALLIRSEKLERKYCKWFRLGVEKRLRLTELYEYYMYSMDPDHYDEVLPVVMSYFQYENHLRDSVKVSFYASIVKNQKKYPEYYESYRETIREFTLQQLREHRISPYHSVLYQKFIHVETCKGDVARALPGVLFTYRIRCKNPNMERVVVVHDEGGEMVYNLVNGEADIQIGTPHYRLYFVDKNGFFHASTISYQITPLTGAGLAECCYENGSDHPVLLLYLFSKALEKKDVGAREAILLHMMLRKQIPGVEYTEKSLLVLYDYYKSIGEEALLEEVVRRIRFPYLTKERRAGILQTMIQHNMKEEALEVLKEYEITNCTPRLLLLLITWKIEENRELFDPYTMKLCSYLYLQGTKNKETLSYLVNYYMGSIRILFEIYQTAVRSGADVSDGGTERLLGQALFVEAAPEPYTDIFLDYYEYGANRMLVRAFLGYVSYGYLTEKNGLPDGIWEKVRKEGLSEDNTLMVLASLRRYAEFDHYSETEKEYIEYHLSRYASSGMVFEFMKQFCGKVQVPFSISHETILTLYYSGSSDIYIELEDAEGKKCSQLMKRVFEGIYVYETLLFHGESVRYRIFDGESDQSIKKGMLRAAPEEREIWRQEPAFCELVNEMILAREKGEEERFRQLAHKYQSNVEIVTKLFGPL